MVYMPPQPPAHRKSGPLVWIVGLIAAAALILGIINFTRQSTRPTPPVPTDHPVFSTADQNAAKERICAAYEQVTASVATATHLPDGTEPVATSVNARAAIATGALALSRSVSPSASADVSSKVNALVDAYLHYLLTAFGGDVAKADSSRAAVVTAIDAMHGVCG